DDPERGLAQLDQVFGLGLGEGGTGDGQGEAGDGETFEWHGCFSCGRLRIGARGNQGCLAARRCTVASAAATLSLGARPPMVAAMRPSGVTTKVVRSAK